MNKETEKKKKKAFLRTNISTIWRKNEKSHAHPQLKQYLNLQI
jgi:hypothetical protein